MERTAREEIQYARGILEEQRAIIGDAVYGTLSEIADNALKRALDKMENSGDDHVPFP